MKLRRMRLSLTLLVLIAAVAACLPIAGAAQPPAQTAKPYRILVSNDDGVRAPGIYAAAQALQALGEVTIVAPADNQSGKGHSITISEPIFRDEVTLANGVKAISLTATPASTVKVALARILAQKPDLVVSGINRGYNLGYSAYLSGTVGAAREGAMAGIPAIAASLATPANDVAAYAAAADAVVRIARFVKENGLPQGIYLNVNVPSGAPGTLKGFRMTSQAASAGGSERFDEHKHPGGRTYYWNVFTEGGEAPEGTDMWAVGQGYVSITPLRMPEYDAQAAAKLKPLEAVGR
jgi:5'/3'-nucleotidase